MYTENVAPQEVIDQFNTLPENEKAAEFVEMMLGCNDVVDLAVSVIQPTLSDEIKEEMAELLRKEKQILVDAEQRKLDENLVRDTIYIDMLGLNDYGFIRNHTTSNEIRFEHGKPNTKLIIKMNKSFDTVELICDIPDQSYKMKIGTSQSMCKNDFKTWMNLAGLNM